MVLSNKRGMGTINVDRSLTYAIEKFTPFLEFIDINKLITNDKENKKNHKEKKINNINIINILIF